MKAMNQVPFQVIFSFIILNLVRWISVTNICDEGETGFLLCYAENATCIESNLTSSGYKCDCNVGYEYDENKEKCVAKDFCDSESVGYRFCHSDKAICQNDPTHERGFICVCEEGKEKISGMCEEITAERVKTESDDIAYQSATFTPLTESDDYKDLSISFTTATSTHSDEDPCLRNNCMKNTTCVPILNVNYECKCKSGFEPKPEYILMKKKCLNKTDICKTAKCKEDCDNIEQKTQCKKLNIEIKTQKFEKKEKEKNEINGWLISTIILILYAVFTTGIIIYLYRRHSNLQNNLNENTNKQLIYHKMEMGNSYPEDSVRNSRGALVISYVIPDDKINLKTVRNIC